MPVDIHGKACAKREREMEKTISMITQIKTKVIPL